MKNLTVDEMAAMWRVLWGIGKGITYILVMIALVKYIFFG